MQILWRTAAVTDKLASADFLFVDWRLLMVTGDNDGRESCADSYSVAVRSPTMRPGSILSRWF
jgi:hypothetical protein